MGNGELWRFITSQMGFASIPQTIVGLILVYQFRQFERQMGPRKFGAFLVAVTLIAMSVLLAFCVAIGSFVPSQGPYFFIYSIFPLFHSKLLRAACLCASQMIANTLDDVWGVNGAEYIPKLYPTRLSVFGMGFSEKSWTYLLGLQLLFSDGFNSLIPGLSGFLAGMLYLHDALNIQSFRLPKALEPVFSFLGQIVDPPVRIAQEAQRRAIDQGQLQAALAGFGPGLDDYREPAPVAPPSEADIEMLMSMGFERDRVVRALQQSRNNVEAAANILLSGR